jgi:hypothetical protein
LAADLADLIDAPRETLDVELKGWLSLSENQARASIARHVAALANHGGGHLVFGFRDDLTRDPARPTSLNDYNRDTFASIVRRYLTPAFQCECTIVSSSDGIEFPILMVPSCGATPIVSKADGPQDTKGRPQGIQQGVVYIRKPGPESAPILTAEEWAPLIRRCLLNDKDVLLRDITALVSGASSRATDDERLAKWHEASAKRYAALLGDAKSLNWRVPLNDHRCQMSYLISTEIEEALPSNSLRTALEEVNNEVRSVVWTGWSMFYPFTRPEIAAAIHPEFDDGAGIDVLESNLLVGDDFDISLPDFWRFAVDGRASIFRAYREDRERAERDLSRSAGTWLSPVTVIRETTELVTHARLMARRFETATQVSFRCSWSGLKGRYLDDFHQDIGWGIGRKSQANNRTTLGVWTTAELAANWPQVVADLSCPILRLFSIDYCGADLVERLKPRFRIQ